jgi:hypothetical protein
LGSDGQRCSDPTPPSKIARASLPPQPSFDSFMRKIGRASAAWEGKGDPEPSREQLRTKLASRGSLYSGPFEQTGEPAEHAAARTGATEPPAEPKPTPRWAEAEALRFGEQARKKTAASPAAASFKPQPVPTLTVRQPLRLPACRCGDVPKPWSCALPAFCFASRPGPPPQLGACIGRAGVSFGRRSDSLVALRCKESLRTDAGKLHRWLGTTRAGGGGLRNSTRAAAGNRHERWLQCMPCCMPRNVRLRARALRVCSLHLFLTSECAHPPLLLFLPAGRAKGDGWRPSEHGACWRHAKHPL